MAFSIAIFSGFPVRLKEWVARKPKAQASDKGKNPAFARMMIGLAVSFVVAAVGWGAYFYQSVQVADFSNATHALQLHTQQSIRTALLAKLEAGTTTQLRGTAGADLQAMRESAAHTLFVGHDAQQQLDKLIKLDDEFEQALVALARMGAGATSANIQQVSSAADAVSAAAGETLASYSAQSKTLVWLGVIWVFGSAALILLVLVGRRQIALERQLLQGIEQTNIDNQEAILHLLDEMGDLADGDLTVKAQVTESITGAIADSINYTIDSLRALVAEINHATEQVNQATAQAQSTSAALLTAAEQQSRQIEDTGEAVGNMTRSILEVSSNAGEASQVAQRSLQAATQGAQAVQNTISGMNEIRTQIQETSKRIKRLGESSQEISEIVELISDITEQTNILALNAAIQAASAGEAGRGFTVVAEEVQRLAERSSEATKQISAIVKTIQTDTNGAVAAMEKSTVGVVEGARLSDAAGQALNEIETVTNNLARLIQAISAATVAQTEVAATVSRNMQQIQNITSQTTDGTKQTAQSVGQLTGLAEELRESVAGFKLA